MFGQIGHVCGLGLWVVFYGRLSVPSMYQLFTPPRSIGSSFGNNRRRRAPVGPETTHVKRCEEGVRYVDLMTLPTHGTTITRSLVGDWG